MEYINLKPRFYTSEVIASALVSYLSGLSSWRTSLPHSTLSCVKYVVPISGFYAVEETKIIVVDGQYYYVWIVRDVKTVPFFMMTSLRSAHTN
ncbi:hypothetical protein HS5_02800 [Acidianus sp. HS-5]|nr:hypothetical protein HS5_02800 [Acidianus sp. HS-5]